MEGLKWSLWKSFNILSRCLLMSRRRVGFHSTQHQFGGVGQGVEKRGLSVQCARCISDNSTRVSSDCPFGPFCAAVPIIWRDTCVLYSPGINTFVSSFGLVFTKVHVNMGFMQIPSHFGLEKCQFKLQGNVLLFTYRGTVFGIFASILLFPFLNEIILFLQL